MDRARDETALVEGSVNALGLSCPLNSELELDLAYVRDALNQGNILGARALLKSFMNEAHALGQVGELSSTQAAAFNSDSRGLLRSIPSQGLVTNEFHPTSQVPAPVPHTCPATSSATAGSQANIHGRRSP